MVKFGFPDKTLYFRKEKLMDPATMAVAAKTAWNTGKQVIGTISELNGVLDGLKDMNASALTSYIKKTLITGRVYVEDQLAAEDITPKLMKMLYSMYSGFILCAVGLTNLVSACKTVRPMLTAIATENFHSFADSVREKFGDAFAGASLEDNTTGQKKIIGQDGQYKDLKTESQTLFTGNLLEVDIPTDNGSQKVKLYFYVQLLPQIIPAPVMYEFLYAHASPTLTLRWAMWKAGEISFWKDFVFECDRVEKRKKALKVDKDGVLREMEDHRNANFQKKTRQLRDVQKMKQREFKHNLANSMVICTKRSIDNVCKDLGINMKNFSQRQNMMNDSMIIMLVVVDTDYGTVDLYMNGIEGRGEYTAKMIDAATKGKADPLDIKELLALINAGSMPRF